MLWPGPLPGQNNGWTSVRARSFTEMVCNRLACGIIESPCLGNPLLSHLVPRLLVQDHFLFLE